MRFSKTQPGSLAVTFVDEAIQIKHCLLHSVPPFGLTLKAPPTVYKSNIINTPSLSFSYYFNFDERVIMEFVAAHKNKLKYPITYEERATLNHAARAFLSPKDLAYLLVNSSSPSSILSPSSPSIPGTVSSIPYAQQFLGNDDRNLCVVCLDAVPNTVFLECSRILRSSFLSFHIFVLVSLSYSHSFIFFHFTYTWHVVVCVPSLFLFALSVGPRYQELLIFLDRSLLFLFPFNFIPFPFPFLQPSSTPVFILLYC